MKGPTAKLAEFVSVTKFDDLPPALIQKVKSILLDSVGCALAGHITDRGKIALELGQEFGTKPEVTIIGDGKASCAVAAFVNGELINALDYEPLGPLGPHVVLYVVPSCLAIGERLQVSGEELITALAIAIEIGGRAISSVAQLKLLKDTTPYYEDSPRYSYNSAIFGAVAGAGKLLGLDEERICSAFGIGGISTPVPGGTKWNKTGGPVMMTKYGCWSGWVAMLGTLAALAAEKGLRGDTTVLDGEYGYWKMYGSPFFKEENLIGGLGKVWHIEQVNFKAYPCCGLNHTGIMAINDIIEENHIKPEEIEEILVKGDPLLQTPQRLLNEINCQEDAQFSALYSFGLAPYHGRQPSPTWQLPNTFLDPEIKNLMSKVKIVEHPNAEELISERIKVGKMPSFWDVIVEVTARGEKFVAKISTKGGKGLPSELKTAEELERKFRNNAYYSPLRHDQTEKAIETIERLEELENVVALFKLLTTV